MIWGIGGGACVNDVMVVVSMCRQQRGSLFVHPPGLNSLNQPKEVLLTFTSSFIQIWKGTPLVLHPVRLETDEPTERETGR